MKGPNGPGAPWHTPHFPLDTFVPYPLEAPGVRAGISRIPVDAADRVAGISWAERVASAPTERVALLQQVHSGEVVRAPWDGFPQVRKGDALITTETGLPLCVRIADCAAVALADRSGGAIGMVHAGWRGLTEGVVEAAVGALCLAAGAAPSDLRAAFGPTIHPCCYRVGPEFADHFDASFLIPDGDRYRFDLPGAVAAALRGAGLSPETIGRVDVCTACGRGAPEGCSWHSHRGSAGAPARNIALIVRIHP